MGKLRDNIKFSKKAYVRDGRAPVPANESISRVMRANKGKNTKPEVLLRKELWKHGIRGYRLHWKKAPGKPDIAFPKRKLAIFVNGCFWHRCPHCKLILPKTNIDFWQAKFKRNIERDKEKLQLLKKSNWNVIIVWECRIKNDILDCVKKIQKSLNERTVKSR